MVENMNKNISKYLIGLILITTKDCVGLTSRSEGVDDGDDDGVDGGLLNFCRNKI